MAQTVLQVPSATAVQGATFVPVGQSSRVGATTAGTITYERAQLVPQPPVAIRVQATAYLAYTIATPADQALSGVSIETKVPPLPTDPTVYNTFIDLADSNAVAPNVPRITDVAVTSAGALRFRDYNTLRWQSPDGLVDAGQSIRVVYLGLSVGSATGLHVLVFVGARRYSLTSPDYDSGAGPLRGNTGVTVLNHLHIGMTSVSAQAYDLLVGNVVVNNDGSDPGPGFGTVPAAPAVTGTAGNGTAGLAFPNAAGQPVLAYRRTGSDPYTLVAGSPAAGATAYAETGLANGTRYDYAIRLGNANGYGPAGFVSVTPAATSSQTLTPDGDAYTAGCTPVNAPGSTLASCLVTNDTASLVKIGDGGRCEVTMSDPSLPLPANSQLAGDYGLGPDVSAITVASWRLGDGTVVLADDPKTGPGDFSLILAATDLDGLTDAQIRDLRFSVENQGAPTADLTG